MFLPKQPNELSPNEKIYPYLFNIKVKFYPHAIYYGFSTIIYDIGDLSCYWLPIKTWFDDENNSF